VNPSSGRAGPVAPLESRDDPRVACEFRVALHTELSTPLVAAARDVSVGGLCVATAYPFAFQSLESVAFELGQAPLRLRANGRWQRTDAASQTVLTGLEFAPLEARIEDLLWDFVVDTGKDIARFIHRRSALRGIGLDGALGIAHASRLRVLRAGELIYCEGRSGSNSIFIVREGSVTLQVRVRDVRNELLGVVEVGQLFGGLALLAGVAQPELAVARTPTRLLEIDERALNHLARSRPWLAPEIAFAVTRAYGERVRQSLEIARGATGSEVL